MRWALGFPLPCVAWLALLSLAAGAGDWAPTASKDEAGGGAAPTSLAGLSSPLSDLEVTGGTEGSRTSARRGKAESTEGTTHRGGRRLDEEEASRILWRGWLLVDEAASRRKAHITPKSVFIAPVINRGDGTRGGLPACAEGYRSDAMGRCHKVVRVNPVANLDFILKRLNALYGEPSTGSSQSEADKGPLLVTIPLATDPPQEEEEEEVGEDDGVDLVVVAEASIQKGPLKDLAASFTGLEEQVVAETHEEAGGETSEEVEGAAEKKETSNSTYGGFVSETVKDVHDGEIVNNSTKDGKDDTVVRPIVVGPITEKIEFEAETSGEVVNSTEETSEIPVTESTVVTNTESENESFVQTTTYEPPDEGTTSGEQYPKIHVYETTIITDYPSTDSYEEKVTVMPETMHKGNQEVKQESSVRIRNGSSEGPTSDSSRVIFPGKVNDRIRFPDSESAEASYQSQSASSVSPSVTSSVSSKVPSRTRNGWNRPMLLKFWTQMPLIREPSHDVESTNKRSSTSTSAEDGHAHQKHGESWSFPTHGATQGQVNHGPYQRRPWIYYQELSPREMASMSRVFDRVRHYENHG